jgi:hypothetical protein
LIRIKTIADAKPQDDAVQVRSCGTRTAGAPSVPDAIEPFDKQVRQTSSTNENGWLRIAGRRSLPACKPSTPYRFSNPPSETMMKRMSAIASAIAMLVTLLCIAPDAHAQTYADAIRKGCAKELKTYCAKVTPGEGRVAYCLLAYEDKLSRQCDDALFYAASDLARMVNARANAVAACEPDARRLCAGVKAGDGNILSCLNLAQKAISPRCNQAIIDARLR